MKREQHYIESIIIVFILVIGSLIVVGNLANTLTGWVTVSDIVSLLNPNDQGFDGQTRAQNYETLLTDLYSSGRVTQVVNDKLWVPWYFSSTQCTEDYLHKGNSCHVGGEITHDRNCMVTDELSQVAILIAMGEDQTRMDQFVNTLPEIESQFGQLPSWRVFRDGNTIEACKQGVNGNCDTASDADARIIISLFTAANNPYFQDEEQKQLYFELAKNLTEDFVEYEVLTSCKQSDLGYGEICSWLAAGSQVRNGGMASTDFGYTGYYSDAIIAMLQACNQLQDNQYCELAKQFTLNYLQASKWNGQDFSTPPGRSFKWTNLNGVPEATCTNTCSPTIWDGADAPRAVGMCQALSYAEMVGTTLPGLQNYCEQWNQEHGSDPTRFPIQYYPDGSAQSPQASFFAQGLQALFYAGVDKDKFETALDDALAHYAPSLGTWDWTACFGVYHQAIPMRALGHGLGRDVASFSIQPPQEQQPAPLPINISILTTTPSGSPTLNEGEEAPFSITITNPDQHLVLYTWSVDGVEVAEEDSTYNYLATYSSAGTHTITVTANAVTNTVQKTWNVNVQDVPRPATIISKSPNGTINSSVNDSIALSVALTNPDAHVLTYNWTVNSTAVSTQPTYRHIVTQGDYQVQLNIQGPGYSLQSSWDVHGQAPPVITPPPINDTPQEPINQTPEEPINETPLNPINNTPEIVIPISFNTTTPASNTITVENNTQLSFTYTINNPSLQNTTSTWNVGENTHTSESLTHLFTQNTTIQLTVEAETNTLTTTWNIKVNYTQEEEPNEQREPTRSSGSSGGGGGGGSAFVPRPIPTQEPNEAEEPDNIQETQDPEERQVNNQLQRFFTNPDAQENEEETISLVRMIRQLLQRNS